MRRFLKLLHLLYLKYYKYRAFKIGKNFHAGKSVVMWAKHGIVIGDNFYIGRNSQIECDAEIGDNVIMANNVALVGKYDHHFQQIGTPTRLASQIRFDDYNWHGLNSKVVIENDVWVGYGTIIMSGTRLGEGSVVAAGSLVTKDIEPYWIYGGRPAKKIKPRFDSEEDLQEHLSIIKGVNK